MPQIVTNAAGEQYQLGDDGIWKLVSTAKSPEEAAKAAKGDKRAVGAGGDVGLDVDPSGKKLPWDEHAGRRQDKPRGTEQLHDDIASQIEEVRQNPILSQQNEAAQKGRSWLQDHPDAATGPGGPAVVEAARAPAGDQSEGRSRVPSGREAISVIVPGVIHVESHGHHMDPENPSKVLTSPAGAEGIMQLMPSSFPGVNTKNEGENLKAGTQHLLNLYDHFGNWDDALAAYNWNEKSVDKWIAGGRDPGKMPAETRAYVPAVLAASGMSPSTSEEVVGSKRRSTVDDILDQAADMNPARSQRRADAEKTTDALDVSDLGKMPDSSDQAPSDLEQAQWGVVAQALRHGAMSTVTGPIQATLEQVNPGWAHNFTQMVNDFEEKVGGAEAQRTHPIEFGIGSAIGSVLTFGPEAKLLGAGLKAIPVAGPKLSQALALIGDKLGWFGRGTAIGTIGGATTFNPNEEEGARITEAVGGAIGGMAIGGAAGAIFKAGQVMASQKAFSEFTQLVKGLVRGDEANGRVIKEAFASGLDDLRATADAKYTIRDKSGRNILTEGFDREEMGKPFAEAMDESKFKGISIDSSANTARIRADEAMGGPQARRLEAEHQAEVEAYEKNLAKWERDVASRVVGPAVDDATAARARAEGRAVGLTAEERNRYLATLERNGTIEPRPEPPEPFEPPRITPEQYSEAHEALQSASNRARGTSRAKVRAQIRMMRSHLEEAATNAAEAEGIDIAEFKSKARAASEFYKNELIPARNLFGESPRAVPDMQFYDKAVRLIEGKPKPDELRLLVKTVGSGPGADALQSVIASRAFSQVEKATRKAVRRGGSAEEIAQRELTAGASRISDYIHDHENALRAVLGNDRTDSLLGMAHIAEGIARNPDTHRALYHMLASHGWLQAIGAARFGEGVFEGVPEKMKTGTALMLLPVAGRVLYNIISKSAKLPGMSPLIRAAGKSSMDSARMGQIMAEWERRVRFRANVGAAAVGQQVTAPPGRMAAPIGRAVKSGTNRAMEYMFGAQD